MSHQNTLKEEEVYILRKATEAFGKRCISFDELKAYCLIYTEELTVHSDTGGIVDLSQIANALIVKALSNGWKIFDCKFYPASARAPAQTGAEYDGKSSEFPGKFLTDEDMVKICGEIDTNLETLQSMKKTANLAARTQPRCRLFAT